MDEPQDERAARDSQGDDDVNPGVSRVDKAKSASEWNIPTRTLTKRAVLCFCLGQTSKGIFLETTFEIQVRARNSVGWSDLSPKVKIRTPAIRDEERDPGKGVGYPGLERFGYKVERPKMLPGVERGKPEDYAKSKLAQNKVPGS